jgi:pSer/pThr/pTyr-binding forkhead associated (FHA) protein
MMTKAADTMTLALTLTFMSGVEDGKSMTLMAEAGDGQIDLESWVLSIGREDDRDIRLQRDSFISRKHATLVLRAEQWWLTDLNSRNGSFVEIDGEEMRVSETVAIRRGQLFKIGRTWMRIQP